MSEELLVNFTPTETRVAVVDNGVLQEVHVERSRARGLVGNIYTGKVARILPGMQAAFIELGLARTAFLHVTDIVGNNADSDIRQLLHDGQKVTVQVLKDPLGTKGARVTTALSVPSRYLVLAEGGNHVGISQRIEDDAERARLKDAVAAMRDASGIENISLIVRTVAEGCDPAALESDLEYLLRVWGAIQRRAKRNEAQALLYEDLPLYLRTLRDLATPSVERIRVDSRETFDLVCQFTEDYLPQMRQRVEHYVGERPIFDLFNVEDEIQKALGRRVELKSGGHLVIDQTEAMTTIDVNTGAFVGSRNLEETTYKTNLEAATTLARQLRLRNLGGIVIIDFIDMRDAEHRRQVQRALEKALSKDNARTHITGVSELGLIEMTRKRTRESLEHILCEPCVYCQGRGSQKTAETVCYEIFREILREARAWDASTLMVLAAQTVIDRLLDEDSDAVADLESFMNKSIQFQVEPLFPPEKFDVVLVS